MLSLPLKNWNSLERDLFSILYLENWKIIYTFVYCVIETLIYDSKSYLSFALKFSCPSYYFFPVAWLIIISPPPNELYEDEYKKSIKWGGVSKMVKSLKEENGKFLKENIRKFNL